MRYTWQTFRLLAGKWWSGVLVWTTIMVFVYGCTPGRNYFPDGGFWVYLLVVPMAGWLACAVVAVIVGLLHREDRKSESNG